MGLFSKPSRMSVAVIDIGSASVGGGLVHFEEGQLPVMCYTARVALGSHENEALTDSMLRALDEVGGRLVREGAPQLRQTAGSGSVNRVLVSVSSPWQTSKVSTKTVERSGEFSFTKSLEREALEANVVTASENDVVTETIIATYLNGYMIQNPYGKKATRAELVVLASTLEGRIVETTGAALRKLFHTRSIFYTGFATPAFTVLRQLYPHEKDVLIVSVTGEETDVASVKRDHLVDVGSVAQGTNALLASVQAAGRSVRTTVGAMPAAETGTVGIDRAQNARFVEEAGMAERTWLSGLMSLLKEFAGHHALPRKVFLVADEEVRGFLKQELEDVSLRELWLSDEPIAVIPVQPAQFTSYLKTVGTAEGDIALGLLALYAKSTP